MGVLAKFCIIELERILVRGRKSCAARPQEEWRHAVSKINRVICRKIGELIDIATSYCRRLAVTCR